MKRLSWCKFTAKKGIDLSFKHRQCAPTYLSLTTTTLLIESQSYSLAWPHQPLSEWWSHNRTTLHNLKFKTLPSEGEGSDIGEIILSLPHCSKTVLQVMGPCSK